MSRRSNAERSHENLTRVDLLYISRAVATPGDRVASDCAVRVVRRTPTHNERLQTVSHHRS